MSESYPALSDFVASIPEIDSSAESRSFDRMMFDVCGEVKHIRSSIAHGGEGLDDALRAFDRACGRIYESPDVSSQRKFSLRVAEWVLKSWSIWNNPVISEQSATRWFDAWQRERNMSLLQL